jgi:hypothetical protein
VNPLMLIDWRHVNALFTLLAWVLAITVALTILAAATPTTGAHPAWDRRRGKPKPTPVTYDTLRMMATA